MANSLLKNVAHNSFANGIFKEILTRSTRYYYFLGRTLSWLDENNPPIVVDSIAYERDARNEMIAMKEITPSDISYVLPRVNWTTGTIYDMYDDQYSSEVQGLDLSAGGTGYVTAPTIIIGNPVPLVGNVSANDQYYYNGYLYTVTVGGATAASNVSLLGVIGSAYTHGTATLACVGIQATATCTVVATRVVSTTITNKGYGYINTPSVNFSSGGASATPVFVRGTSGTTKLENSSYYVTNASNVYVCVDNNRGIASTVAPTGSSADYLTTGDGYVWKYMSSFASNSKFLTSSHMPIYTANQNQYNADGSIVNVFVDNEGSGYLSATAVIPLSTAVLLGEIYYYLGYVYTVTVAGTTAASYGVVTTTTGATYVTGGATFSCSGVLTTISVVGDGSGAVLTPLITDGKLTGVQINNKGLNYSYTNALVVGAGSGAVVSLTIFVSEPRYSNQAYIEDLTVVGNICSIKLISGGYNYTTPIVTISGNGTGATASATISGGRITKIIMTNHGTNYQWATISISDASGKGASGRAVLSPYGGLGKDPTNQLCCKSLMFYAKTSDNTNQGIAVTNDYRQIGIIKDPLRYKNGTYLTANFATPCWKIVAAANIIGFTADEIVTSSANSISYRFRVVSISTNTILLIPLDNGIPALGMQFINASGASFLASVTISPSTPTVDKYSGDLMFIDNESAFISTSVAPAIIRTVINF